MVIVTCRQQKLVSKVFLFPPLTFAPETSSSKGQFSLHGIMAGEKKRKRKPEKVPLFLPALDRAAELAILTGHFSRGHFAPHWPKHSHLAPFHFSDLIEPIYCATFQLGNKTEGSKFYFTENKLISKCTCYKKQGEKLADPTCHSEKSTSKAGIIKGLSRRQIRSLPDDIICFYSSWLFLPRTQR